ncbi:CG3746 [Drosophila busckii]|uniref:CG3746 n=2 Tax=Drosophila busckii TaxID=30019 RepID=A0A0M4EBB1_DROBS|nr:CG3746 [Drosophila busckii]
METQRLQLRLLPARTAEERARNIIANVVLEGQQATLVPYIDEQLNEGEQKFVLSTQNAAAATPKAPRLRYYAAGPSTYKLLCPLCKERGDAAVMRAAGCKDASCCLSLLSCVFPIFWLCCVCTWCGCNREWTTKGVYCSRCGGKLGMQQN